MRIEDLTDEQLEQSKLCKTHEEREAFIQKYALELDDDMLDDVSGGKPVWKKVGPDSNKKSKKCPKRGPGLGHEMKKTSQRRPGKWFPWWEDVLYQCEYCGETEWKNW